VLNSADLQDQMFVLLESLSPSGMPLLGCAKSGMPLFSFFPLKDINKLQ
jgi:hypothetical protein